LGPAPHGRQNILNTGSGTGYVNVMTYETYLPRGGGQNT